MAWPVFPFSNLTGFSSAFFQLYDRWPPETLQVLVVGGGGNGAALGVGAGGGGGGGVRDVAFSTGLTPGEQQAYAITVDTVARTSSFNVSISVTGGLNGPGGATNLVGGASGSPNGYGGGNGMVASCANTSARFATGGGGGAYSGVGLNWSMVGNDYYSAAGRLGYSVSAGVANAIGSAAVGNSGAGGAYVGGLFANYGVYCGHLCRQQTSPSGSGLGLGASQAVTNGTVYGAGGGGSGGLGRQGVVVVSYPGTQASPSGTVTSYGGSTYHTFTSSGSIQF